MRDLVNNKDIVIRIQDKWSRFVLLNSTDYVYKMEDYLNDSPSFCTSYEDPTDTFLRRVSAWSQKWLSKGEINDTVVDFVTNHSAQPAKKYGLLKTHKPGCKFRVITAGSNSATIHLSAFTEKFLGPLARSQEHILVDTTDFLNFVNLLNTRYAPMPEEVLLVSWDIEAMYPSIDNKLGLEACRDALNTRSEMKPSTECILEAIKITLECNNSTFNGKHYLEIDGAQKRMQLC